MQDTIRDNSGKWLNSDAFREEALRFRKTKAYCPAPELTPDWYTYWEDQLERCKTGYQVGNHKITGHHYSYLNFTEIKIVVEDKTDEDSIVATKEVRPPDFWDGDYDYFWSLEIAKNGLYSKESQVITTEEEVVNFRAHNKELKRLKKAVGNNYKSDPEYISVKHKRDVISIAVLDRLQLRVKPHLDYVNGGHHMITGKARRKGYSYKNGAICSNTYNTVRNAQIVIAAFEKKYLYPKGTMAMTADYINYINQHTAWSKSMLIDKQDHKKAGYEEVNNGVKVIKGYQTEVFAISFRDNPDASRGKDPVIALLEEAGAFPNLKEAYNAMSPSLTGGSYITGQILIFGTGGDMESGTVDFADMFYNPEAYGLMPFVNIWDEDAENTTCGFFHPTTWNMEGFYDSQGNSDIQAATEYEVERRQNILEKSTSSLELQGHMQEFPFCPSEAFLTVSSNNMPVLELRNHLNKVIQQKLHLKKGTCVYLERKDNKVTARPDLKNELVPILSYRPKNTDLTGCPVIYEYPIDNAPKRLYKIGYDPYRQDLSNGVSLAAIYVYKTIHKGSYTNNTIVAQYIGRPQEADDVNRIASMLADLYNAEIMHENEVTHVKNYFRRIKRLDQLAVQPDSVISKNVKNSTVARIYGTHMVSQLKEAGEKYIKDNLLQVRDYDENGNAILNLETIFSIPLLEELIQYNRKGNFDSVMAYMMCMFQIQEDELGKEYTEGDENEIVGNMYDMFDNFNNRT